MTKLKYILKSFLFFRKQHLAVLAGTIITTAVLTGALIVGDSVKYSLNRIVEKRLGNVQYVLQSNDRFVTSALAREISGKLNLKSAPLLLLQGLSSHPENDFRINKTQVVGIDSSFWQLTDLQMPDLNDDEAIISTNVAEKLNLNVDDEFILRVEKISLIPINSPFSTEEVPSISFRLKVKAIAGDDNLGRFSLKNNQVAPYNIFISREYLSNKLELNGLVNVVLISGSDKSILPSELFEKTISESWQLKDAGVEFNKLNNGDYEITSNRIFIDKQISSAILNSFPSAKTILTYLVNSIQTKERSTPYSFVTAVSENYLGKEISENEIIINDWLSEDLNAKVGDTINLKYFVIDYNQNLREDSNLFVVKEIIPTRDSLNNRSLMPKFPGFAEAVSCMEWNTNIPIDLKKIRDKDEDYWNEYRGTPKAIISIEQGKKLWQNKYGDYTSIRLNDTIFDRSTLSPSQEILSDLAPEDLNLSIVDMKTEGINAAKTGVDFGELFLSLSFFVILAGLILTVMLYVLNLNARKSEIGLLISMGYRRNQILNLQVYENTVAILIGSVIGVLIGILYNYGLMSAINSVWNDIVRTSMLDVSIKPMTLLTGFLSGLELSVLSIYVVTYFNLKKTASGLINNSTQSLLSVKNRNNWLGISMIIIGFIGSSGMLLFSIFTSVDKNATLFLASGGMFILGSIALTNQLFSLKTREDSTKLSLNKLSFYNASRNKTRSLTIVILISLGVFVVVITGANRTTYIGTENDRQSGTGGYTYWAETSVPLPNNLNTIHGREKLGISETILNNVYIVQLQSLNGDDASCLNLNHVQNPRIIGISPEEFDSRSSFSFEKLAENVDPKNSWLELNNSYGENVIPAFADQTVITWGIMKKIGDTLTYVNEAGKKLNLVLIGGLSSSVFQGNILISEKFLKDNFPSMGNSKLMLIDVPENKRMVVSELLYEYFKDYGIEITKTTERLSQFNSVTNTYLSVFMLLGGLGVIIGTIGIAILLYRNMLDRKQEIAMMMALGYTKHNIFSIIFKENLFLIILGLIIGILSSFIGILPSLISISYNMSFVFVLFLIIIIFTNSIFWVYFSINKALKKNIIQSLRNE